MRNAFGVDAILRRAYQETVTLQAQIPREGVPALRSRVCPVHEVVEVDVFVPGCPPSANTIHFVLSELLAGRRLDLSTRTRFGA
jgi:NAD-reducing hydrogenase small subunit